MNPSWDCASTVQRITIGAVLCLGSAAFAWPQASSAAADCAEIVFVHQFNGRADWNRVYAEFLFDRGNLVLSFKPWARINESSADDDNPDIIDFLGHYEVRAAYKWRQQLFSVMLRNVFDSEHRYNSELMWSFPIKAHLRGLVQWYHGYGESLIDYNHNNHRIGIGLLMTDWL